MYDWITKKASDLMNECKLAKALLNAVWESDIVYVERLLELGAEPNWVFNGYPLLLHALYLRDWDMTLLLISYGAQQLDEALGFVLDRCVGEMIAPLIRLGAHPKLIHTKEEFGLYPSRYCPITYHAKKRKKEEYEPNGQLYQNAVAAASERVYAAR